MFHPHAPVSHLENLMLNITGTKMTFALLIGRHVTHETFVLVPDCLH